MPDVELFDYGCQGENQMRITIGQIAELLAQDKTGVVTRENFQQYLRNPNRSSEESQKSKGGEAQKFVVGNFGVAFVDNFFRNNFGKPEVVPEKVVWKTQKLSSNMTGKQILRLYRPKCMTLAQLAGQFDGLNENEYYLAKVEGKNGKQHFVRVYVCHGGELNITTRLTTDSLHEWMQGSNLFYDISEP